MPVVACSTSSVEYRRVPSTCSSVRRTPGMLARYMHLIHVVVRDVQKEKQRCAFPVVLENNNRYLTQLSTAELLLFRALLSCRPKKVPVSSPWAHPEELGPTDVPSVRPSAW